MGKEQMSDLNKFLLKCFLFGIIFIIVDLYLRFFDFETIALIFGNIGGSLIGSVIGLLVGMKFVEKC